MKVIIEGTLLRKEINNYSKKDGTQGTSYILHVLDVDDVKPVIRQITVNSELFMKVEENKIIKLEPKIYCKGFTSYYIK